MMFTKKCLILLAVVALALPASMAFGQAANITLATAPKIIDTNDTTFFGADPAEIGSWQYIYDVNVTSFNFAPRFKLQNFDTDAIVNKQGAKFAAQKWDFFGTNTSNAAFRTDYGSSGSGAAWVLHGTTGLGGAITNFWHAPADYSGLAPSFGGGGWAAPAFQPTGNQEPFGTVLNHTLNFNARTSTSTPVNGLIATIRIVHPNSPGTLNFSVEQFGNAHTGTVLGPVPVPAAAVPEPTSLALIVAGLAGLLGLSHRRRRRATE